MSLSINTTNPNNIYAINLGTSSPKLSGSVNITSFSNLTSFVCKDNDIESFTGSNVIPSLAVLNLSGNKLTAVPTFSVGSKIETLNLSRNPIVGDFDLSLIPNIKYIDIFNNNNVRLTNYGPLTGLEVINARDTIITNLETLTNKPNIRIIDFAASTNNRYASLTGQFPVNLSHLTKLESLRINNTSLSSTEVVNLSGCTLLKDIRIQNSALSGNHPILPSYAESLTLINVQGGLTLKQRFTGNIPQLSSFPNLIEYTGSFNNFSGEIPTLDYNPNIQRFLVGGVNPANKGGLTKINSLSGATSLQRFVASVNSLSGDLPYLGNNTALTDFEVQTNSLSGGTFGPVLSTLGNFNASSNILSQTAVNGILSSFAAAGRNSGTRVLNIGGSGNQAPSQAGIANKNILISRGWTVTTN